VAGRPVRRARLAAQEAAQQQTAQARPRDAQGRYTATAARAPRTAVAPTPAALPPDAKVVALAGALCLGQYRGTIRASGAPLPTALAVLDEQLPSWVERVQRQLEQG
jgi:hypothetical protein